MKIWQFAAAPESYVLDLTPGTTTVDLSTVTAADLQVKKSDGTVVTWAATRSNQAAATLTLTHLLAGDGSEVDLAGTYVIYARLTTPSGVVRSRPRNLIVKELFQAD